MRYTVPLRRHLAVVAALSLAFICSCVAAKPNAAAADPLRVECSGGVCSAIVHDPKVAVAPCLDSVILLAWRRDGGATLIQCETDDADMDKPSFVYDRTAPARPAYALTGMRFFDSAALGELAGGGVPDKFQSHSLCQRPAPARMADGELLLGEKVPSDDDKNPYCYRVLRVATTPSGVTIKADDHDSPKPMATHAEWDKLAAKMSALIRDSRTASVVKAPAAASAATSAPAGATTLHVVHAKAPLLDSVGDGSAPHGYLVQGDAVTVLDRSKLADGWLKIRYVGKSGKAIERWVHADDVEEVAH